MLVGNLGNARKYRDGGFTSNYDMEVAGLNYRMTNLQASVGCAQLERIDELVQKRLENAERYKQALKGRGKWLFVAECSNPVSLANHLRSNGIDSRPVFRPLHLTQAFRQAGKFKNAERIWETGLCLPTGPHLSPEEQKRVIENVARHLYESESGARYRAA